MQTLLTSAQMRDADAHAIVNLPISPINLMEQAAQSFVKVFKREVPIKQTEIAVLCGKGNNGADGLAIARLLSKENYKHVQVHLFDFTEKQTEEFEKNWKRLSKAGIPVNVVTDDV